MKDGRLQNFEVAIAMLRREVNIWDPIGLLDCGAPDDEYECIVGDLFSLLKADATPDRIADYLRHEFSAHFGVRPRDPAAFGTHIVALWREVAIPGAPRE